MKYEETGAALENFFYERDAAGYHEPQLLEDPGTVHARWERSEVLDFVEYGNGLAAVCGRLVRVLLPLAFDSNGADACPDCARRLAARAADPDGWEERRRQRQRRRDDLRYIEELKARRVTQLRAADPGSTVTIEDLDGMSREALQDLVYGTGYFDDFDDEETVAQPGAAEK